RLRWKSTAPQKLVRRLTRWLRLRNHQIRSVARNAFQHRSGHSPQNLVEEVAVATQFFPATGVDKRI
ncbi:hypothetical protein, partial [Marivita sp. LZ-15-2]|uniref:hypothetical protein n=1 Tax=Marivita sp. LZ-15-2 TaxID=2570353 RepID=UPI001BB18606